ncbi:T-cell surface glycoprotein CD1c isoform X1 [Gorilla gorilla gorilla]|uniref:T-cell surface glycoprotein CD1c isoform X1 n=1 Tax=Gorilla gorilla gorilla TaxID=9595 RepID=UPI00123E70A3|nr:T-cell surface glycoprotein CD1c isoform X3 [Gorilla gorilla gorilla]
MLFLQFLLLALLLPGGDNADASQEHVSFHVIQILSFVNQSWARGQGSGWLDELQTHGWDSESGTIIFLHTWSKGNFSNEELSDLELLFRFYLFGLTREIQDHASQHYSKYPFEVQVKAGCELHSGKSPEGFFQVAFNGLDLLSFQNTTWVPSPGCGSLAQSVCHLLNHQYEGVTETVYNLIRSTCPRFLLGLLDAGKMYVHRQVRPEAWLSSHPSLGPGQLLLVCHASGFYPKPVWVTWMRNEQEQLGTKHGDILPNADGTWYLQVILEVASEEAAGLSCRVRHSSLGGQDIILYWAHIKTSCETLPPDSPIVLRTQQPRSLVQHSDAIPSTLHLNCFSFCVINIC